MALTLADFDYDLPPELIAQHPLDSRSASRLLHLREEQLIDHLFSELPLLLDPGDVLVFNDTRVIKARLLGEKNSGGRVEVLIERVLSDHEAIAQVRASHAPQPGAMLRLAGQLDAKVLDREGDLFRLRFETREPLLSLLERFGLLPLPPYITHPPTSRDEDRYQTVYSQVPGAVAAPTAGLHFDEPLLAALRDRGVVPAFLTLHVGAGTFQPVRVRNPAEHRMHSERFSIPAATAGAIALARSESRTVVAVGTTALRALEASALAHGEVAAGNGETDLFILPGFTFRVADRLITNFHLPRSTLLMLACAFGGTANVRRAYEHAIGAGYRFFSYGDAMLIDRAA